MANFISLTKWPERVLVTYAGVKEVGDRWTYLCVDDELPCSEREFMAFLTGKVEAAMQISYPVPPPWVTP